MQQRQQSSDPLPVFQHKTPDLTSKARVGKSTFVTFPVTTDHHVEVDGVLYAGVHVPDPIIPKGYELYDPVVGKNLNTIPHQATRVLRASLNKTPRAAGPSI